MAYRATIESKTEGTTWKSIKNYRNWFQNWCCILFRVIYGENKQCSALLFSKVTPPFQNLHGEFQIDCQHQPGVDEEDDRGRHCRVRRSNFISSFVGTATPPYCLRNHQGCIGSSGQNDGTRTRTQTGTCFGSLNPGNHKGCSKLQKFAHIENLRPNCSPYSP